MAAASKICGYIGQEDIGKIRRVWELGRQKDNPEQVCV